MKTIRNIYGQYKGLSKGIYFLFLARMITSMGAFIWPMLTLILSQKMNYNSWEIARIFVMISIIFLPATVLGGKLADKFNKNFLPFICSETDIPSGHERSRVNVLGASSDLCGKKSSKTWSFEKIGKNAVLTGANPEGDLLWRMTGAAPFDDDLQRRRSRNLYRADGPDHDAAPSVDVDE